MRDAQDVTTPPTWYFGVRDTGVAERSGGHGVGYSVVSVVRWRFARHSCRPGSHGAMNRQSTNPLGSAASSNATVVFSTRTDAHHRYA